MHGHPDSLKEFAQCIASFVPSFLREYFKNYLELGVSHQNALNATGNHDDSNRDRHYGQA